MKSLRLVLISAIAALHLSLPDQAAASILQTDLQLTGTLNKIKSGAVMTVESGGGFVVASSGSFTLASGATVTFGAPLSMANGGTGSALTGPGADRILFWDESAGMMTWLQLGSNISIAGTTINVSSGGDFSSNTSSSVDGELVLFSGTAGKTGKRATLTGLLKLTAGVGSAASSTTDYVAPGAFTSAPLTMATARLLGRTTAGTGAAEELTISAALDLLSGGSTRGSLAYRGATGWTTIAPGTSGYVLASNGLGADPTYQSVGGTVTHTGGALSSNGVVLGAGSGDTKTAAGLTTDGTSQLTLGEAGTSVGSIVYKNATSGSITVSPATGALGTVTYTLPAASGNVVIDSATQNLTNKTLNKVTVTAPATSATITIADGKTFTVSQNTTLDRQSSTGIPVEFAIACSDMTTAITAATNKAYFRAPYAFTVTEVRASLFTAQSAGSIFTVDINESGTSILSTKLTIDNTEKTSQTAATPPVISDSSIADDAEISVDVDQIGTSGAAGLVIWIKGYR
jgi:hypothetical protein